MIANGTKQESTFVCPSSHYNAYLEEKDNIILASILQMDSFVITPFPVTVELGTCNMRALSTSDIQTFEIMFSLLRRESSYPVPLNLDMAITSESRSG